MSPKTVPAPAPLLEQILAFWPETKRTRVKQWLRFGAVHVNDRVVTRHDHPLQAGDVIAVMEAMKMEMQVTAHRSGRITLQAAAGSYQAAGSCIARIT